jgi:hypothetical protein
MGWVPASGWLTKVVIDGSAAQLKYDLAISATASAPSPVAAGLETPRAPIHSEAPDADGFALVATSLLSLCGVLLLRTRRGPKTLRVTR